MLNPVTRKNEDPESFLQFNSELGRGKFGRVISCQHKDTKETYAVKVIEVLRQPRHENGDLLEVAILGAMGFHENIACFHSAYEYLRKCYILTECINGGALFDRVIIEDNLDERICAHIIRQILLGVQHIQSFNVLHLDLKPENVMMVAPTGYDLKIVDFGLARFYNPKNPPRCLDGTFLYSAPEVIKYEDLHFSTDIWSIGVLTYEILSGVTPFEVHQNGEPGGILSKADVTRNIITCNYDFEDDGIRDATSISKNFIRSILQINPPDRPTVQQCLQHRWLESRNSLPKIKREVSLHRRHTIKDNHDVLRNSCSAERK